MAQNDNNSSGFALPAPSENAPTALDAPAVTTTSTEAPSLESINLVEDTSSRDLMVGGAIILVLLVAFFFAKNAYANTLVAKRVPPNKANTAGWWLFIGLAGIAIGVVLAAVSSSRFMTPFVLGPLGGVGLLGLILAVVTGRK